VYSRTVFPVVFVLPALTATKKDLSRLLGILGVACVVAVALGFINSDFKSGRMSVDQGNGELTNSNDYAAYLTLMLPALAYLTLRPGRPKILNVFGIALSGISIYEILSTGSRGGLVGLGVMLLFVAFVVKGRVRFAILIGIPVVTLAALPFIPQESAERLKTLFSSDNSSVSGEAVESKEARMELLKESLRITWQHPLTGIGPDQFMVGQAQSAKERGQRGMWHVTHNSWTQVSSECGIPAALLYISAVVITFLRLFRHRKNPDKDVAAIALTGAIMLVGFSTCICFLSMGYAIQLLVLTGLANAVTIWADNSKSLPATQAVAA
jgi:O-antigen ligase